ncbi:hypothetical protein [Streptomyces sp. NPDC059816]|uniref:hypothetical protein n=1 Tax=Streptomyces sp. NPDC059816 TaxID=3346960 RepID=UPI0036528C57
MADDPIYFVITTGPGGESTEYVSQHPLDAALHVLRADRRGEAFQVFTVDERGARTASLAGLAAPAPSSGFVADMWRNAQASWLRYHLDLPNALESPWGPDTQGAAAQWSAVFRAPLPDGIEEHPELADLSGPDRERLRSRVDELLPLLEHESQWRFPEHASRQEWAARDYQQAWRQLNEAARQAPALRSTADFFLGMALDRDTRAGRVAGFLGTDHPGLEQWARVAYLSTPEQVEEADQLYASFTPDADPLTEEEQAWAERWPRERQRTRSADYLPDAEEAQREYWQNSQTYWTAAEEQESAQYAAFAFLAERHEEITTRAPAGAGEGVVAQARRLLRAAFPSEQQARRDVALQLGALDALLDVPEAPDQTYELGQHGQVWMALGRVEEALRALTWNQSEPDQEPGTAPAPEPALLRVGPDGGPYAVTADPRKALSVWTQRHRPGPDTLFPANPARIEESTAGGRWRERTPRSLVEQVRSTASGPDEHWEVDRELALWLLADEPEGLHPEEMGARWSRYLGEVPPRGPVLAWVLRLSGADASADVLVRIQQGAAEERAMIDWALDFTRQRRAVYRPAGEREEAAALAAMDDAELEAFYPGQTGDELGARPVPPPRATILASATIGNTRYAHAEFTRPPRHAVIVYSDGGFPSPYTLASSRLTDTDVLFTELTSPAGRALAAAEGTGTAQRTALETAGRAWEMARRSEERADRQLELYELVEQARTGELDPTVYAQQAGQVWDELFPLLEGRGPLEADGLRRWYSIRVAGNDTAWGTLTADPLEAVVQWAQRDRPVQQYVILTGIAESSESTEIPVGELLAQALRSGNGQEARLAEAMAGWLDQARRSVAVRAGDEPDPAAWRQAGWAWRVRVGESLPPQVTGRLEPAAARAVVDGEVEMLRALRTAGTEGTGSPETLQAHFRVLAAASVEIEQARSHARAALDRLISDDQGAPGGDRQGLRQNAARLWLLSRDLGRGNLLDSFRQVADPENAPQVSTSTLAALPQRLREHPSSAHELLRAAERAVGYQAREPLYADYPNTVREEAASAAHDASAAFLLQAAAEATRGQATSRVHDLRAGSAPAQSGPSPLPPARADRGLDATQRAALPPAPSQAPTVR